MDIVASRFKHGITAGEPNAPYSVSDALPDDVRRALSPIFSEYNNRTSTYRTNELREISIFMDGDADAFSDEFFPQPDGYDLSTWLELKSRLMVLVNLLQASVRKVRHRVYGGYQRRVVVKNPYKDDIERLLSGDYSLRMRDWFTNRAAFSNAACVVSGVVKNGKPRLRLWTPDPCFTYLASDPHDDRYIAIAEFSPDGNRMQFVTENAEGVIYRDQDVVTIGAGDDAPAGSYVRTTNMGFLPAVIAHGESRRNKRSPYSNPPFRGAIKFTVRATDTLFNGSLLQKLQTKGILVVNGVMEDQTMDLPEMMRQGLIYIDKDGGAQFLIPQSNIGDTLSLLDRMIEVYSVVHAIPVDDLNPTSGKGTSAEEATRRAEPYLSLTREFTETATLDEQELVVRATGVLRWMDTAQPGPVDIDDLRDEVETDISLQPPLKPLTSQSDAHIAEVGARLGTILPEDQARMWNDHANAGKIKDVVANMEKIEAAAKAAQVAKTAPPQTPGAAADDTDNTPKKEQQNV